MQLCAGGNVCVCERENTTPQKKFFLKSDGVNIDKSLSYI